MKRIMKNLVIANLIGFSNSLVCGVILSLFRLIDFEFPMVTSENLPFFKLMMVLTTIATYLIQNLISTNILAILISIIKNKKYSIWLVIGFSLVTGFIGAYTILGSNLFKGINGIGFRIPGEIWITPLIYLPGFYYFIIRNKTEELGLSPQNGKNLNGKSVGNSENENRRKTIILGNLIGFFNALLCGFLIAVIRMGNEFYFPMSPPEEVFGNQLIVIFVLTSIYLLQNIFGVNILMNLLRRVKTIQYTFAIIIACAVIPGYMFALIFSYGHLTTISTLIHWIIPEEVWITAIVYLLGFYFLFIRKMQREPDLSTVTEAEEET